MKNRHPGPRPRRQARQVDLSELSAPSSVIRNFKLQMPRNRLVVAGHESLRGSQKTYVDSRQGQTTGKLGGFFGLMLRLLGATDGTAAMSKYSKICEAWVSGDHIGALRIAARFFDRSADTQIFKRGMDAHNHPNFYRQLRQDPDQITAAALQLLARKFNLTPSLINKRR